jgi:hypothetical protein
MRTLLHVAVAALLLGACAGNSPAAIDSGRTCAKKLYDRCIQEHDCDSGLCQNFVAAGFTACAKACTPGDDASCGTTLDGRAATCTNAICTPPGPNDCSLP